jgi:hypothetical protein
MYSSTAPCTHAPGTFSLVLIRGYILNKNKVRRPFETDQEHFCALLLVLDDKVHHYMGALLEGTTNDY